MSTLYTHPESKSIAYSHGHIVITDDEIVTTIPIGELGLLDLGLKLLALATAQGALRHLFDGGRD